MYPKSSYSMKGSPVKKSLPFIALILWFFTVPSMAAPDKQPSDPQRPQVVPYKKTTNAQGEPVTLNMHIFNPANHTPNDKTPCIVFFFGGGWTSGSPTQFYSHCQYLAEQGMVAMTAEYRVENRHQTSPIQSLNDAKSAIRWARQHACELGVDPNHLAAGGGSAGGHLAAATGSSEGFEEAGEDVTVSSRPDALVLFNPVIDNGPNGWGYERVKPQWKEFSPYHNVTAKTPPTVIFLGTKDKYVPVQTAETYKEMMEKQNRTCRLFLYDGQPHGFFNYRDGKNPYYQKTVDEMVRFLEDFGYIKKP